MTGTYAVVDDAILPLALRQVIACPDSRNATLVRDQVVKHYYTASEQVRDELRLIIGEAAGGSAAWEKVLAGMYAEDARRERIREQNERNWAGWPDDEEWGPDHGYPSDDELHHVRTFQGSAREFMEFIAAIWRNGAAAEVEEAADSLGNPVHRVTLITAGWSGCESIISAMHQTLVTMYMREWKSGGYWVFEFRDADWDVKRSWAYPGERGGRDLKLYERLRDRIARLEARLAEAVS